MAELSVSYVREKSVQCIQTGSVMLGDLVIDQTNVPEDQKGGTSKQLMATSAIYTI